MYGRYSRGYSVCAAGQGAFSFFRRRLEKREPCLPRRISFYVLPSSAVYRSFYHEEGGRSEAQHNMPHLFVNRPRAFGIKLPPEELLAHFKWELINTIFYQVGGVLLLAGSILFLPKYEDKANIGDWLFIVASVFYLTVSAHDCWEIYNAPQDANAVDTLAASSYLVGAICFILGSILFLPDLELFLAGGCMFIIGSILFVVGAFVNSIQIFDSPTRSSALYANLTAVSYVIGSIFYLTGSIPYLWEFNDPNDSEIIFRYLGEQFIVGSILFIIGGTFNIYRAKLVVNHYVEHDFNNKRYATSAPTAAAAVEESYRYQDEE
eukprot:scaffold34094_cov42-Attheya_sp.AAC.1